MFYVGRGNLIAGTSAVGRKTLSWTKLHRAPYSLALKTSRDAVIWLALGLVPVPHNPHSKEFLPNA